VNRILTIVGPTAAGKAKLSIELAKKISGEIISADSRKIYKFLDIGTAKLSRRINKKKRFHLIDFVDPDESYSCGQFARDAEIKIIEIQSRGKVPIVCGGTGLYIKALYQPLHKLPESDIKIKRNLTKQLNRFGIEHLYKKLRSVDPEWAAKIQPKDKQRIMRGLAVYEITGKSLSSLIKKKHTNAKFFPYYVGLIIPREELYKRIDKRFDRMIKNGLIKEIQLILKRGFSAESTALKTIGYKEIVKFLQGTLTLEEAIQRAKIRTRNFAKRQIIWFRRIPGIKWYNPEDPNVTNHIIDNWKKLY
jgi:tRNA dimethylallyltransferase